MYFQSEDNHETIRAKTGNVLRNYRFKHELTMTFLFNIYAKQRRLKRWGENDGASSHTWQLQEKMYEKPIRFWRLDLLIHCVICILFNPLLMSKPEVVYRSFFQFWLIFPNQNYQSRLNNIISTDTDIAHFLWRRKDSLSSKIWLKHQELHTLKSKPMKILWNNSL